MFGVLQTASFHMKMSIAYINETSVTDWLKMPIVGFKRKQMTLSHDICDTLFEDAYCQLKETARSCTNDVPPHSDFSNNVLGSYSNLRLFFTRLLMLIGYVQRAALFTLSLYFLLKYSTVVSWYHECKLPVALKGSNHVTMFIL